MDNIKQQILELKAKGMQEKEIAKQIGISTSKVNYWTNESGRQKAIARNISYFRSLSNETKKKIYESRRKYQRDYNRKRYNSDPIFREKCKERARNYLRNKQ